MLRTPSLRIRILLIVFVGAMLPLALTGVWLTRTSLRSGEELLGARLDEAVEVAAQGVRQAWIRRRSDLLSLGDLPVVQQGLAVPAGDRSGSVPGEGPSQEEAVPEALASSFRSLTTWARRVTILDAAEHVVWILQAPTPEGAASEQPLAPALTVRLEIYDLPSGRWMGTLVTDLPMTALLDDPHVAAYAAGTVLAAFDPASGASLLPLPFDPAVLADYRFVLGGHDWLSSRRELVEPPVTLVTAAPLTSVAEPFERAARRGLLALIGVALLAFGLTAILMARVTRSLSNLTRAAEAVAKGDLARRVEDVGDDEVGRVGRAFNTMTESLRRTLRELADRKALAAVGEFAASLSHEIRNALTSIRVDLQLLEEGETEDSGAPEIQRRALEKVTLLNRTVDDALSLARSGRVREGAVDLLAVLRSSAEAAAPEYEERGVKLLIPDHGSCPDELPGDQSALEQLFLNLLLNAAQAQDEGGSVNVAVTTEGGFAVVSIRDGGKGIPKDLQDRVFEPFFSTRPDGTGLGLAIVRQITQAHGGRVSLQSSSPAGTTVEVRLPLAASGENSGQPPAGRYNGTL
jgi:signal transduction histidine kinase